MAETNPMYDPRCNHDLPIPGPGCNRGMWTCRYPECTYPEAAPRRVRTQVERAADDHAWRAAAGSRPNFATWPHTQPGDPSWWRRSLPCGADPAPETEGVGEVTVTLWTAEDVARYAEQLRKAGDVTAVHIAAADHVTEEQLERIADEFANLSGIPRAEVATGRPPRRRWWHRPTRRAL